MPNQDKLHVTATEHAEGAGGYKAPVQREYARLPFSCCCLTLQPWGEHPVAALAPSTQHVYLFDLLALVPYLRRHSRHPISGDPLSTKDLVRLKFHRNGEGAHACPATGRVFGEHTKIAAVRTTGHVYSWEALETLCLAPKNWKDLVDGTPFQRADVLVLQDTASPDWLHAHRTSHIRGAREALGSGGGAAAAAGAPPAAAAGSGEVANSGGGVIRLSQVARSVLAELPRGEAAAGGSEGGGGSASAAHVSSSGVRTTHHCAASLTSTAVPLATRNVAAAETAEDRDAARWARTAALGKKGLVRLITSLGALSLELHCDLAPRTCENFLLLARRGYYSGTPFHRSIKGFMLQGGDPTGSGRGGASAWGRAFKDEFHARLAHDARGVLSMANAGPNTNGSQFFITYKACTHLDRKHSVFGRLVGGEAVLAALEALPTDGSDRPRQEVQLLRVEVFVDPCAEAEEGGGAGGGGAAGASSAPGAGARAGAGDKRSLTAALDGGSSSAAAAAAASSSVGKYLQPLAAAAPGVGGGGERGEELKQQAPKRQKFDFSSW